MSKYWSPFVESLTPYVPGEQPGTQRVTKLNTNENPYGPSPRALEAIRAAASDTLRRYPDPESTLLRQALAKHHGVNSSQIFVGNGSDEVLAHIFNALFQHDAPVLFPDVTYSFYPVYCALYGIPFETIALRENFSLALDDYNRANGGVIFANPNAPTGRSLSVADIETFVKNNDDSVVVIDEAYVAFGANSAMALIERYPNIVIVQTLSKSHGLAGLRVGAAFADAGLIEALQRVKNSFNSYPLDNLAIAGAVAAIEDAAYFETTRTKIIASRERLTQALRALHFDVIPSTANFVFTSHPDRRAVDIAAALREQAIIVRHFSQAQTQAYLRITVGTDGEIDRLLEALEKILQT